MRKTLMLALALFVAGAAFADETNHPSTGGSGGVSDHGGLTGLADDDHTQYCKLGGACTFTAPILFSDGNAAAPGIGGTTDATDGIYWEANGLRFAIDGVQKAILNAASTTFYDTGTTNITASFGTSGGTLRSSNKVRISWNGTQILFQDDADATKILEFDMASISAGTTRIVSWPDSAGTVAMVATTETSTSNDFDPDRLLGDTTDDDKVDQDILEGFGASATPSVQLTDSDTTDEDVSASLSTNCTTTTTGAEDCDLTIQAQINGADSVALAIDASEQTVALGNSLLSPQVNLPAADNTLNDDDYSGVVLNGWNCGATIAQWDAVYLDDTTNEWAIADADLAGAFPADGIAVAACTDGNPGIILVQGIARNDGWTWAANGATLYLSDGGTGSTVSATAPATLTDHFQSVGIAVNDDQAFFNFMDGTNLQHPTDDAVMVGSGTKWVATAVGDCDDSSGNHLNYDTGTNAFSCGTSSSGGSFDPSTTYEYYEEFDGGTLSGRAIGRNNMNTANIGSGSGNGIASSVGGENNPGALTLKTGVTDNTGIALVPEMWVSALSTGATWVNQVWEMEAVIYVGLVSDETEVAVWFGLTGGVSNIITTDKGTWLRYDTDRSDTTFVAAICDSATTGCQSDGDATNQETVDSTISVADNTRYRLRMRNDPVGGPGSSRLIGMRVNDETELTFCSSGCDDTIAQAPVAANSHSPVLALVARGTTDKNFWIDYWYIKITGLSRY